MAKPRSPAAEAARLRELARVCLTAKLGSADAATALTRLFDVVTPTTLQLLLLNVEAIILLITAAHECVEDAEEGTKADAARLNLREALDLWDGSLEEAEQLAQDLVDSR